MLVETGSAAIGIQVIFHRIVSRQFPASILLLACWQNALAVSLSVRRNHELIAAEVSSSSSSLSPFLFPFAPIRRYRFRSSFLRMRSAGPRTLPGGWVRINRTDADLDLLSSSWNFQDVRSNTII